MARTYTPGAEADAIVDRLLAAGRYRSPDDVVRACIGLLQRHDLERAELMRRAGESDADIAAGRVLDDAGGNLPAADDAAPSHAGPGPDGAR